MGPFKLFGRKSVRWSMGRCGGVDSCAVRLAANGQGAVNVLLVGLPPAVGGQCLDRGGGRSKRSREVDQRCLLKPGHR